MTRRKAVIPLRLKDYLSGRVDSLPELEEARLNPCQTTTKWFQTSGQLQPRPADHVAVPYDLVIYDKKGKGITLSLWLYA